MRASLWALGALVAAAPAAAQDDPYNIDALLSTYSGTSAEVCELLERAAYYSGASYEEDCRAEGLPGGIHVGLYRGEAAFSDPWNCESDILMPGENMWSRNFRGALYLFALLYCFLGIAIVADVFMNAIETITSKEIEVEEINETTGVLETKQQKVWNGTVANLTLMALGSSAPEILLSILGVVFTLGEEADPLGPGTIVGSAAFNLLVISAVCIIAPVPEVRTVKNVGVFYTTSFFSVWAYVWLLLIIEFISPEEVMMWEAAVTLLHFPLLVFVAYGMDKKWKFGKKPKVSPEGGAILPADEGAARGSLQYRMNAVRLISGAPRIKFQRAAKKTAVDVEDAAPELINGSSSDPYVKLSFKGGETKRTNYKRKALNPVYNETFTLTAPTGATELLIEVIDHDDLTKDDFMGQCKLPLSGIKDTPADLWLGLSEKNGVPLPNGASVHIVASAVKEALQVVVVECKSLPATEKVNEALDAIAGNIAKRKEAMQASIKAKMEAWEEMKAAYRVQFETALRVAGDLDDDGNELPPSGTDMLMHFLTVFWKVFFAFIPPADFGGGWLAFGVALTFIGGVTFIVGEIAGLFGCVVGLLDQVTAITFVALGTSLPDTFASKLAAKQEETADNAIGNVTGSNGVNVFLGIGLPWLIAAAYQEANGETFVVRSNGFGLSVFTFIVCACIFLAMMLYRKSQGCELGGDEKMAKMHASFSVVLWLCYVIIASLRYYDDIGDVWSIDFLPTPPPPPPFDARFAK
jgi:Ca2+/Na+ antiporter